MNTKFLKKKVIFLMLMIVGLFSMISCENNDDINDLQQPEISNFATSISAAPGYEFIFEGTVTDDSGIQSVNIYYENWFLDKYISFNDEPKEYNINYKFLVPENETPGSSHTIKVGITDVGGNTITQDVLVTLDLDVTSPLIAFTAPEGGASFSTGDVVNFTIGATDDFGFESIQIKSDALGVDMLADINAGDKTIDYSTEIQIPDNIEGVVVIEAIATDQAGNTSTATTTILVGLSVLYTDMYMVGGSVWWEWDQTKATKMWQDPNDDQWFIGEFYYFTDFGIKFIGQLDWQPNNWGLDPNNSDQIINDENSGTIEFAEGDGYYRVRFNPYTLQYDYEKMTVDVAERDNIYIMGKGFVGYPLDWNPADGIPMQKDGWGWGNPYMFTIEIEFSDDVALKFLGQNDGWGPYDCGFELGGEQNLPMNYVANKCGDGSPDVKFVGQAGRYYIVYDTFLGRTTIHPVD